MSYLQSGLTVLAALKENGVSAPLQLAPDSPGPCNDSILSFSATPPCPLDTDIISFFFFFFLGEGGEMRHAPRYNF